MTLFTPGDIADRKPSLLARQTNVLYSMEFYYYEHKVQILFTKMQLAQVSYQICSSHQVLVFNGIVQNLKISHELSRVIHLSLSLTIHLGVKNFNPSEAKIYLKYYK